VIHRLVWHATTKSMRCEIRRHVPAESSLVDS
jgi:hypothetical protein